MLIQIVFTVAGIVGVMIIAALLNGCEAARPFAHVDRDGYQVGMAGTWQGVAKEVRRATGAKEDFKEAR